MEKEEKEEQKDPQPLTDEELAEFQKKEQRKVGIIGTGYSKAYCESNKVTENEAVDDFWMNYVSEKNQKLSVYIIGRLNFGGTDANQAFSVRPYITVKF